MTFNKNDVYGLGLLRAVHAAALAGVAALLVACGGESDCTSAPAFEGEAVGNCVDDGGGSPTASALTIELSSSDLSNDGSSTITATVTAVDSNRNALAGIPVTVSVDNDAIATVSGTATDALGVMTAKIGIGANRSNRTVTVTAKSGSLSSTKQFSITGTSLTAVPLPAVADPGSANNTVTFTLQDKAGIGMAGQKIIVNGVDGVEVSGTTNTNGIYAYTYTAPAAGGDLIVRATGGGVSVTQNIRVQTGSGTFPPASVVVRSPSISASPSVVAVNTPTTSNQTKLRALFLGANNLPVENIRVRFDLAGDANSVGGVIGSGSNVIYSNANGEATTEYSPGSRFSPTDGLTVRACWSNNDFPAKAAGSSDPIVGTAECPNAVTATLTVTSTALSVSISTNSLLEIGPSGLDYIKKYLVQVNDSSGNAKAGVQISPSIDLVRYFKGDWTVSGDKWIKNQRAACDNEDLNRNGVLEVFDLSNPVPPNTEDANNTGSLEPRKADVNISFVGSSTTNSDGQVVLKITYGQSLGSWIEFDILVAASGVAGTEGRTNYRGVLPVLADAVSDPDVEPAFRLAPYGVQASPVVPTTNPQGQTGLLCTNPN